MAATTGRWCAIRNETTFEHDIADMDVLRAWLMDLVEQVGYPWAQAALPTD